MQKITTAQSCAILRRGLQLVKHSNTMSVVYVLRRLASRIMGYAANNTSWDRKFRAHFGVCLTVASQLWICISTAGPEPTQHIHLFWALYFLKVYSTEEVSASKFSCDPKTCRKWVRIALMRICRLKMVLLIYMYFLYISNY